MTFADVYSRKGGQPPLELTSSSTGTGWTMGRHVNCGAFVRAAALAACLLAVSTATALGIDDSNDPGAPPSKSVITPVRVAQGLNLGEACERYYPLSSRAAREDGATTVVAYVDVDGRVTDTRIETSSGYVALDEATERCLMEQGRFVAQTVDGTPVGSWQRLKTTWRLAGGWSPRDDALRSSFVRGDYAKTVKLLIPYAREGSVDAQIMLGRMYLNGMGVAADAGEAAGWMRKAAEQGSTVAAYEFGVLSENGIGCPKDYPAAAYWFRKAAHQRQPDAAFSLALLYQSGLGVERDSAMALLWINAAIGFLAPIRRRGREDPRMPRRAPRYWPACRRASRCRVTNRVTGRSRDPRRVAQSRSRR